MNKSLIVTNKTNSQPFASSRKAQRFVRNLKQRIERATREGNLKQVKALMKLLRRSYSHLLISLWEKQTQNCLLIAKEKIRSIIRKYRDRDIKVLIAFLNKLIKQWSNRYENVVTKAQISFLDYFLFVKLKKAMKRRHPKKQWTWVHAKYWGGDNTALCRFADKETGLYLQKFKDFHR